MSRYILTDCLALAFSDIFIFIFLAAAAVAVVVSGTCPDARAALCILRATCDLPLSTLGRALLGRRGLLWPWPWLGRVRREESGRRGFRLGVELDRGVLGPIPIPIPPILGVGVRGLGLGLGAGGFWREADEDEDEDE